MLHKNTALNSINRKTELLCTLLTGISLEYTGPRFFFVFFFFFFSSSSSCSCSSPSSSCFLYGVWYVRLSSFSRLRHSDQ